MSDVFIVPDIHGNVTALRVFLEAAELIEPHTGKRTEKGESTDIISIGDLANCVRESRDDDLACLDMVGQWIDLLIVGNHELPYFMDVGFAGFQHYHEIREKLRELEKYGYVAPAAAVQNILITHAGLTNQWGAELYRVNTPSTEYGQEFGAPEAVGALEHLWKYARGNKILSAVGHIREGSEKTGSIFWSDYSEPKFQKLQQIIGHTPGKEVRQFGVHGSKAKPSYCIDLGGGKVRMPWGARLAGAFINYMGEIRILEVELD